MCFILKTNTNRSFPPKCLSEYNSHFEGTKSVYISLKTPMYRYQVWVKHFYSQKTIKQHNLNDEIYIYICICQKKQVNEIWFISIFKNIVEFLTKLNILLPYDPAVVFLGIYTKDLKTYAHTKTCKQIFVVT